MTFPQCGCTEIPTRFNYASGCRAIVETQRLPLLTISLAQLSVEAFGT